MINFWNWLKSLFTRPLTLEDVLLKHEGPVMVVTQSVYSAFYAAAKAEMGVEEIPGTRDNPRIEQYHATTTLKATDDETPWCSSFACWVVEKCGKRSTSSARARSWMEWGVPLKEPVKGCIVVLSRDGGGHVGFFHSKDLNNVYLLGGNQSNRVNISAYPLYRVLGYRGIA